jgi:hypothetical protein
MFVYVTMYPQSNKNMIIKNKGTINVLF